MPPAAAWSALAPIAPTWAARSPLIAPPLAAAPPQPARRAPLDDPLDQQAPEPGRVVGLASGLIVRAPAEPPTVTPPGYLDDLPPLRHASARPLVVHTPLTAATEEFVGEPVAPAPPPPPPSFAQPRPERPDPAIEARTEAGARFREALANLHKSGLPRYEPGMRSSEAPAPAAAPPAASPVPDSSAPVAAPPPLTHRRSLAESRRLGLGAPIPKIPTADELPDRPPQPESLADALQATAAAPPVLAPVMPAAPPPIPVPASDVPNAEPPTEALRLPLAPLPVVRPIADATARPTTTALPLVFRAGSRRPDATPEPAVRRGVVTRPPAELARALRSSHGIDVADVPVRQDAASTHEASRRRARAFTREATVHLPENVDVETSGPGRALLAHELVHAAQQRRLGPALPAESSPEGRALESEALAAEQAHGGTPPHLTSTEPLRHAPPPVTPAWVEDRLTQHARWSDEPGSEFATEGDTAVTQDMAMEIKYHVQKMLEEKLRGGGGGGGGGGGSYGSANLDTTAVGTWRARDKDEFRKQIIDAYNLELQLQGMPTVDVDTINKEYLAKIDEQFDLAEKERIAAKKKKEELEKNIKAADDKAKDEKQALESVEKKVAEKKLLPTADGGHVEQQSWVRGDIPKSEGSGSESSGPAPTGPLIGAARGAAITGGTGPHGGGTDATTSAVEQLDLYPPVTKYQVRTADEFEEAVFRDYSLEMQLQGYSTVPPFTNEQRLLIRHEFNEAQSAAVSASLKKAQAQDRKQAALTKPQGPTSVVPTGTDGIGGTSPSAGTVGATGATGGTAPTEHTAPTTSTGPHEDGLGLERLEQLAEKLYEKVRSRLRSELLVDRERSGMPINR